ncbi:MAG TPA: glycosyltransferase family 4 protein [Rhodothermales bacterium]|nr:glycosyltransferase family 4 protein [Rhodothermales bacterium]
MKVAYVVKRYPRYSETFIVNEILAHEAAGLEVEIYSLRQSTDTHFQDNISKVRAAVTYLLAPGKVATFLESLRAAADVIPAFWTRFDRLRPPETQELHQAVDLARHVVTRGITHLHAHFATSAASVARMASILSGRPYSFTAHAKDIYHESVDRDDLAQKMRDAASVVTVSDFNVQFLKSEFSQETGRLKRIYNGLSLDRFPYEAPEERQPLIIGVGRLVEKKGFDVLIRAARVIADAGRSFECRIIGSGEDQAALEELIEVLDVGHLVKLLGPRPQGEVIRNLHEASVFAAPCVLGSDGNRDGLPTVLLESMALGTPCVSTDVTGIPEVLIDGKTGLQVPQHDPITLADAIVRLLDDGSLRRRLSEGARRLIEREFDIVRNTAVLRASFSDGMADTKPVLREAV